MYRAHDTFRDMPVAVKFVRGLAVREALARFSREARLMASITHPNVVRVLEIGRPSFSKVKRVRFVPECLPPRVARTLDPVLRRRLHHHRLFSSACH